MGPTIAVSALDPPAIRPERLREFCITVQTTCIIFCNLQLLRCDFSCWHDLAFVTCDPLLTSTCFVMYFCCFLLPDFVLACLSFFSFLYLWLVCLTFTFLFCFLHVSIFLLMCISDELVMLRTYKIS